MGLFMGCVSAVGIGADQRDKTLKSPVTPGSRARADLQLGRNALPMNKQTTLNSPPVSLRLTDNPSFDCRLTCNGARWPICTALRSLGQAAGQLWVACCSSLPSGAVGRLPRSLRLPHPVQYRLMRRQYPPQRGFPLVARFGDALVHLLDPRRHLLGQAG